MINFRNRSAYIISLPGDYEEVKNATFCKFQSSV